MRIFQAIFIAILLSLPLAAVTQQDIVPLKTYADSFNASRNAVSAHGPIENYCLSSGTFLTTAPCNSLTTCYQTANLVCSVSGSQGCAIDILASAIYDYTQGLLALDSAMSSFYSAYNSFSPLSPLTSLNGMESAFNSMESAATRVEQNKLRLPDKIPCPCSGQDCCIGRCPEPVFNRTAITLAKEKITDIRLMKCIDGTIGGQCSAGKPSECVLGVLNDNSAKCGCPPGMRAAPNGKTCEFIPCIDNGATVASGACSPYGGRKCVEGVLIDSASACGCPSGMASIGDKCEYVCPDGTFNNTCSASKPLFCANRTLINNSAACGCPDGHIISGNSCACPSITSQVCNTTIEVRTHNVTYYFDRGMKEIVEENYTFEKTRCYLQQTQYGGPTCAAIASQTVNSTPVFESPDAIMPSAVAVACGRCPAVCTRNSPVNLACGSCACPPNLGFCEVEGMRKNISFNPVFLDAFTPAYCFQELLLPQKNLTLACANNFECASALCHKNTCTDRSAISYRIDLFFGWFAELFGGKSGSNP